jgi:DNA modification methylase
VTCSLSGCSYRAIDLASPTLSIPTDLALPPLVGKWLTPASLPLWKATIESVTDVRTLNASDAHADLLKKLMKLGRKEEEVEISLQVLERIQVMLFYRKGELVAELVVHGNPQLSHDAKLRLSELNVQKDDSSRAQRAVRLLPRQAFEEWMEITEKRGEHITKSLLLEYATDYKDPTFKPFRPPSIFECSSVTRLGYQWNLAGCNLTCRDVFELLPQQKPVDLIIMDSPYGQKGRYGLRHRTVAGDDNLDFLNTIARECYRLLPKDAACLVFGQWRTGHRFRTEFEKHGFRTKTVCCWDKGNSGLGAGLAESYEQIYVFYKGHPTLAREYCGNVFHVPRVSSPKHPAEKPIELIMELMSLFEFETVLDPFSGSGPILRAAHKRGRICYAYEWEPSCCDLALSKWIESTGIEPILASTGQTFSEVARERRRQS